MKKNINKTQLFFSTSSHLRLMIGYLVKIVNKFRFGLANNMSKKISVKYEVSSCILTIFIYLLSPHEFFPVINLTWFLGQTIIKCINIWGKLIKAFINFSSVIFNCWSFLLLVNYCVPCSAYITYISQIF